MKKLFLAAVCCAALGACAANAPQTAPAASAVADFAFARGKMWQLHTLKDARGIVLYNIANQSAAASAQYLIQFEAASASGRAAPNRYRAPYTLGKGSKITFAPAVATQMMGVHQPVGLYERDYFNYLAKTQSWEQNGKTLILHTQNPAGQKATMLFNPAQ